MKTTISILSIAIIGLLQGCHYNNEVTPAYRGEIKISKMTYSIYNDFEIQFSYHPDGRLNQRLTHLFFSNGSSIVTISKGSATYLYNGDGQLSSLRFSEVSVINFIYDSRGNIIQSDDYNEMRDPRLISKKYFYTDNNRMYKAELGSWTYLFTYDLSGNLSSKTQLVNGVESLKTIYQEYDHKPNPFKANYFIFDAEGFDLSKIDYFSNNNPVRSSVIISNHNHIRENLYQYNKKGLWTKGGYDFIRLEYVGN
jgi:hypothetical protein